MNKMFKKIFSVTALLSVVAIDAGARPVSPTFVIRSQSFNGARKVSGEVGHKELYDMDEYYGTLWAAPFYQRSFRPGHIAECLFGEDLLEDSSKKRKTIKIQGSNVQTGRDAKAWLADSFYLSPDFDGTITFEPRIQNAGVALSWWMGFDEWVSGLYLRVYGPINWSRWDLDFKETVNTPGSANQAAGVFTPRDLPNAALLKSFEAYAGGGKVADQTQNRNVANNALPVTITFDQLKAAKITKKSRTETQFADLRAAFGWNFLNEEDYHLGLNIQGAAPTGNKRKAEFAFDAVVGNGNKWELGGGLTAHYVFWRSEDEEKHLGIYLDANVTHLFKSTENRTFDLKGKPVSRYMLAHKLATAATADNLKGGTSLAKQQFNDAFAPVANLTTSDVEVSVGAQGDVSFWFNYTTGGLSWDLGYNFWGRSCEKIKRKDKATTPLDDGKTWALKGDAHVFGFMNADEDNPPNVLKQDDAVALSATQNGATINNGLNKGTTANANIDNKQLATAGAGNKALNDVRTGPNITPVQTQTSIQPIFIKLDDVDLKETRGISHKVFSHLNYTWDREGWVPYLGVGGEAEFGKRESRKTTTTTTTTTSSKADCIDCALSQWGLWVKLGLSYN